MDKTAELVNTDSIFPLVKLVFLGISLAILIISFALLFMIMNTKDIPQENVIARAREIWKFMYLSLAVIVLGIVWQALDSDSLVERFMNPEIPIVIDVDPVTLEGYQVEHAGKHVDLQERKTILVKRNQEINIELHGIYDQLTKLNYRVASLENKVKGLTQHTDSLIDAQVGQVSTEKEKSEESGL